MTRFPSQCAYARCDGQLAGFAPGTARHRADDGGRLFGGDDADNCGLRLPRLLGQFNFVNRCRWQVAKDDGACRPLARTCHRSALATVSPASKPHTQTQTHRHTHTHIACHPAINSDRGHEGALRCSALVAEGFCRREPLGRSSWAWFLRRGRPANLNIRIVSTSTPLQPVWVHSYCNLFWSKNGGSGCTIFIVSGELRA